MFRSTLPRIQANVRSTAIISRGADLTPYVQACEGHQAAPEEVGACPAVIVRRSALPLCYHRPSSLEARALSHRRQRFEAACERDDRSRCERRSANNTVKNCCNEGSELVMTGQREASVPKLAWV